MGQEFLGEQRFGTEGQVRDCTVHRINWLVIFSAQGSLLKMRGAYGLGSLTRRSADAAWCDPVPVRVLIGDFTGNTIGFSDLGPVILVIFNPVIADLLARGDLVSSEDYSILGVDSAATENLDGVDVLVAGAAADRGILLLPGRSVFADIIGADTRDISCGHVTAQEALDPSPPEA